MTLNRKPSVFSFRLWSLGFSMSFMCLSPRSLSRGLWSTTTVRSGWPRVKNLVLSRAQATASISPSTGWYLVSAAELNLEPTQVTCQPMGQHRGDLPGQSHVFCISTCPMPILLQSVRRAVGRSGS